MAARVTRRDFLNGVAIGTGGLLLHGCGSDTGVPTVTSAAAPAVVGPPDPSAYYPPTLTGMRGSHKGSFEVAHALAWRGEKPTDYQTLDEHYDLIIVGGGLSGLASAYFYRQKMGPDARILLLDNHDDFGGHAKRNEFHHEGRMLLSLGGSQNLSAPGNYDDMTAGLMIDIGLDEDFVDAMGSQTPEDYFQGGKFNAANGVALPGPDGRHVVVGGNWAGALFGADGYREMIRALPIPVTEQDTLIAFVGGDRDFLDGLSLSEKWDYIHSTSYNQFLLERVGLAEETIPLLGVMTRHLSGVTGANLTVMEAMTSGSGGTRGMGWLSNMATSLGGAMIGYLASSSMFPDGNASVARLLVQNLIPAVAPDMKGPEDVAVTRFNYDALDREKQNIRLRLNSTVVGVREVEGKQVEVDYVTQGKPLRITADRCVLACYNGLIPHLCPELPESQKEGLAYGVKTPFVYANVLLENGQAFSKLGATLFQCPKDPFQAISTGPTMTSGGYQPPRSPDDPMVVVMMNSPTPASEGKTTVRDQLRFGRHKVYNTSFASYEQQIRDQLQSILGQHGFNHETDIRAITVNRIPHGYAYSYHALDDPEWEEGQAPHEIGRAQFGRISIANTDSEARASIGGACSAAWRAVEEQT
jgi:spermidine dehydrogenase